MSQESETGQARNTPDLEQALYQLCLEVAAIWREPRLLGSPSTFPPKTVVTRTENDGPLLPRTKRPIRGGNKVKVDVREGKFQGPKLAEFLVKQALLDPWTYQSNDAEIEKGRASINSKTEHVLSIFKETEQLPERLFEALASKQYEPEEVRRRAQEAAEADELKIWWMFQLAPPIGRALASLGFDPERKDAFKEWWEVAKLAAHELKALAARKRNRYRVVTCLNSPLIDQESSQPIADLSVNGEPIEVCLSGVTDELLTELFRHTSGTSRSN